MLILADSAMANEQQKELAARASLQFVREGDVVGLGSGSTAAYTIRFLGERVRSGLTIRGIATSVEAQKLAASQGIPLTTLEEAQQIDVTIDGADEFDPELRLIKGGGGALLREKIVASATRQEIIVVDSSKQVPILGQFPLPVEVIRFAEPIVFKKISSLGATVELRKNRAGKPFITDEGNHILDCHFGQIPDPPALAYRLSEIPGVVEHGLFIDLADLVLLGKGSEVLEFRRQPHSEPSDRRLR